MDSRTRALRVEARAKATSKAEAAQAAAAASASSALGSLFPSDQAKRLLGRQAAVAAKHRACPFDTGVLEAFQTAAGGSDSLHCRYRGRRPPTAADWPLARSPDYCTKCCCSHLHAWLWIAGMRLYGDERGSKLDASIEIEDYLKRFADAVPKQLVALHRAAMTKLEAHPAAGAAPRIISEPTDDEVRLKIEQQLVLQNGMWNYPQKWLAVAVSSKHCPQTVQRFLQRAGDCISRRAANKMLARPVFTVASPPLLCLCPRLHPRLCPRLHPRLRACPPPPPQGPHTTPVPPPQHGVLSLVASNNRHNDVEETNDWCRKLELVRKSKEMLDSYQANPARGGYSMPEGHKRTDTEKLHIELYKKVLRQRFREARESAGKSWNEGRPRHADVKVGGRKELCVVKSGFENVPRYPARLIYSETRMHDVLVAAARANKQALHNWPNDAGDTLGAKRKRDLVPEVNKVEGAAAAVRRRFLQLSAEGLRLKGKTVPKAVTKELLQAAGRQRWVPKAEAVEAAVAGMSKKETTNVIRHCVMRSDQKAAWVPSAAEDDAENPESDTEDFKARPVCSAQGGRGRGPGEARGERRGQHALALPIQSSPCLLRQAVHPIRTHATAALSVSNGSVASHKRHRPHGCRGRPRSGRLPQVPGRDCQRHLPTPRLRRL